MREDVLSLVPPVSRREFAVTTLAAGFAMATQPVAAQTITTDTTGLTAGEVKIPVQDGTVPAYRAAPDTLARNRSYHPSSRALASTLLKVRGAPTASASEDPAPG